MFPEFQPVDRIDETGSRAHTMHCAPRTCLDRGSLREALHPRLTCEPAATTTITEGSEVKTSLGMWPELMVRPLA
jgi:hypothetical protein